MFEKLATTPSKSVSKNLPTLVKTAAFLACVRDQGFRLSYGALAQAARDLGEDKNGQILAQRGGKLVVALPLALQPFVCKKSGKYSKGVDWKDQETPADLGERPVIEATKVGQALEIWKKAEAKAKKGK
jgi:hypothetical protein